MATRTPEPLLSVQDVADWLGKPVGTLYQWRHTNRGPRGIKVGGHVRYRRSDVEAWLEDHADALKHAV
ncbi:MAG: helix-turn-helix domain-containing protein [Acidimicrobiia bacterium]|nr:helix-turn-helix domain-containing protein [Acidimicrobiia bacterium]